jgi:hypothetical protein
MVEFMLCLNLTVHRCTAVQILPYKFKKSILGHSPHIWIISVKEASGFPVLSFGTKVITSNCWQLFECFLLTSKWSLGELFL